MKVHFTIEQIHYLMAKLGTDDPDEALDIFIKITDAERVDPEQIHIYLDKLMKKDGVK